MRQVLQQDLLAQPMINDPALGAVDPATFKQNAFLWPGDQWQKIELFQETRAQGRRVAEYHYFSADREGFLPVAFVFDPESAGVFVYSDHHLVEDRGPILAPNPDLIPWQNNDDVLYRYFQALKANDLPATMSHFDENSYFQHSNGSRHNGLAEIRKDFVTMLGDDGIQIKYCRVTDDGSTCIIECYMPTGRPAIAIYERRDALLHAVRIHL